MHQEVSNLEVAKVNIVNTLRTRSNTVRICTVLECQNMSISKPLSTNQTTILPSHILPRLTLLSLELSFFKSVLVKPQKMGLNEMICNEMDLIGLERCGLTVSRVYQVSQSDQDWRSLSVNVYQQNMFHFQPFSTVFAAYLLEFSVRSDDVRWCQVSDGQCHP